MAAGLTIKADRFDEFKTSFNAAVAEHIDESDCEGLIYTDGELLADWISIETAQLLQQAGPWGQQFPEPCFDGIFELLDQRIVGGHHLKLSLCPVGSKQVIDAIAFNIDLELWPNIGCQKVHMAYRLDVNEFRGQVNVQLMVTALVAVS
jgi:single-stranded-DNA-specific exonuclease